MKLTNQQYDLISKTISKLSGSLSEQAGIPVMLMWGCPDGEAVIGGVAVPSELTFSEASKIVVTCAGIVHNSFGDPEGTDLPPLDEDEFNYYNNLQ